MSRSFILGYNVSLYIDASDLQEKIEICRDALSPKGYERLMNRTFNEVGKKMTTITVEEARKEYDVTKRWIRSQIKRPEITLGAFPVVKLPLSGHKGSIGAVFKARGRRAGKVRGVSVKGRIVANIVTSGQSVLPQVMRNQGGNPPFVLYVQKGVKGATGKKPKGSSKEVVFTRRGPGRLPIVAVKGLAVPQMPLNRSASKTQDAILEYAGKRLESNFKYMFGRK
jgi:hypothetical protein